MVSPRVLRLATEFLIHSSIKNANPLIPNLERYPIQSFLSFFLLLQYSVFTACAAGFRTTLLTMFFQHIYLSALCAAALLTLVSTSSTGHAVHRHHPRMLPKPDTNLAILERRAAPSSVDIPAEAFSALKSEFTAFSTWMNSWFSSAESVQQLNQELQSHNGFVKVWLKSALSGSAAPALPAAVPVSRRTDAGSVEISQAQLNMLQTETTAFVSWMGASTSSSMANIDAIKSQIKTESQAYQGWISAWLATASPDGDSTSAAPSSPAPSASVVTPDSPAPSPASTPPSSAPAAPSVGQSAAPSAPVAQAAGSGAAASAPASSGSFNAKAKDNVAVYYGQSPATNQVPLTKLCSDPSVNIVILAFLSEFFSAGGLPTMDFGSACGGQSSQMEAKGATGMLACGKMATDIATCQSSGKKVLLSLGGATAQTAFTGDDQAKTFASTLWDLFGGGTGLDAGLRPFGSTKIDGFDVGKLTTPILVDKSFFALTFILQTMRTKTKQAMSPLSRLFAPSSPQIKQRNITSALRHSALFPMPPSP